mmetsp:Transcript_60227/g.155092  ORF Transcript_60227/g.155092 Transcript_60227/m.155092 type:complete len:196 (-) Transcript_60227:88-675(-)
MAGDKVVDKVVYLNIMVAEPPDPSLKAKDGEAIPNLLNFQVLDGLSSAGVTQLVTTPGKASEAVVGIANALPEKLSDLGIKAECKEMFKSGSFLVVKTTILDVEEAKIKPPAGASFLCCAAKPQNPNGGELLDLIIDMLPQKLPDKLRSLVEAGMTVEVVANSEGDQKIYFENAKQQFGGGMFRNCAAPATCCIS